MTKYIPLDALIAEIEKRRVMNFEQKQGSRALEDMDVLNIIDTLEVKEVDLEEEFDKYCDNLYLIDLENEPYAELFECAKHFFELGFKAQKGK